MLKPKQCPFFFAICFFFFMQILCFAVLDAASSNDNHHEGVLSVGSVVRKDERKSLVSTEYGEISAVEISDGSTRGRYHLQFMTLEPNALFLPVLLHADMVFYVHSGSGRLSWVDEDEMRRVNLQRGDVYRLRTGTVFFVQSNLEQERQKLRIYSIFTNAIQDLHEPSTVAYSSITDLVLGFNKKVLQAAFNVPEEVIQETTSGANPQVIVHAPPTKGNTVWQFEAQFMKAFLGSKGSSMFDINNKKTKAFNILKADPDFQNCDGWSLMVTRKKLPALRGSGIGLLMVNLTKGAMMGPHWNPMATEISIVTQGRGIVRMVCSSSMKKSECKNTRFRVEEGDVFVVPRFHPMAQMAFNNDSLVFVGFSKTTKKNHPQFLAGKASVLQTLDREIVAASFNVTNTTISQLLAAQGESIILECTSCAEEEERKIEEEEIEKEKEEARKREEEEEAKKREEERRREEEEAQRREEEEEKREEEARRREEEEARKREEEEEIEKEKEEVRKREEEEAKKREEERRREEEEAQRREEEEEKREEEARRREEEEARKREEEKEEEEEERRREEEEAKRREEEEERRREEEEAKRREEEEERKQEEEEVAKRREEEKAREEEEARREQQKREQAEKKRRRAAAEREEEKSPRQEQEREEMERQEEKASRERERKQEEEEAKREEEEQAGERLRRRW